MKDRRKIVARIVRNEGPIASRRELAKRTGIPRETLDGIADGLIKDRLIREEQGPAKNSPRRIVWAKKSWYLGIGIISEWSPLDDFRYLELPSLAGLKPGRRFFTALIVSGTFLELTLLMSLPMHGAGF